LGRESSIIVLILPRSDFLEKQTNKATMNSMLLAQLMQDMQVGKLDYFRDVTVGEKFLRASAAIFVQYNP
jgi:hypothetical protein